MTSGKSVVSKKFQLTILLFLVLLLVSLGGLGFVWQQGQTKQKELEKVLLQEKTASEEKIASLSAEITLLQNEDTRKTNQALQKVIEAIEKSFTTLSHALETVADARFSGVATLTFEKEIASSAAWLAQKNYEAANTQLAQTNKKIVDAQAVKVAAVAQNAVTAQDLPGSGSFRSQTVSTDRGSFTLSLIAEKTASVKMLTDTANDDTCTNNCPTLPLATFVARNGGFAGINGTYFCPQDYPSCASSVNSYNTLVFNARLKKYMNSDQNVYSTVPMVVQNADRSLRFLGQSLEWGRDTGIIGGLANNPMLVSGGKSVVNDGSLDEKSRGAKTNRGFIGIKGDTLYIGVVFGATVGDAAVALATLGIENAINLDGGGSSALYYNGAYKVGPGRNLPNAVILAR